MAKGTSMVPLSSPSMSRVAVAPLPVRTNRAPTTDVTRRDGRVRLHHVVVAEAVVVEDQTVVLDEQAHPGVLGSRGVEHRRRAVGGRSMVAAISQPRPPRAGATWAGRGDIGGK